MTSEFSRSSGSVQWKFDPDTKQHVKLVHGGTTSTSKLQNRSSASGPEPAGPERPSITAAPLPASGMSATLPPRETVTATGPGTAAVSRHGSGTESACSGGGGGGVAVASTQARTYGCEEGSHLLAGVLHPHEARGKPAPLPLVHRPSDSAHLDAACRVPCAACRLPFSCLPR